MNARTIVLLIIVLAMAALAALNWGTLATPTQISLGLATVEAPLGLLMLGLTVLLGVFFIAYVLSQQSTMLMETRRLTKEMLAQRELADKAESSRFTELRQFLQTQQQQGEQRAAAGHAALLARLEQSDNATAAYMGEIEDRLERQALPRT
ncbi:MAG TPA: LapA family protein [Burkholderiaceae bacterium]